MEAVVLHFLQQVKSRRLLVVLAVALFTLGWQPFWTWRSAWIAEQRYRAVEFQQKLAELEDRGR